MYILLPLVSYIRTIVETIRGRIAARPEVFLSLGQIIILNMMGLDVSKACSLWYVM